MTLVQMRTDVATVAKIIHSSIERQMSGPGEVIKKLAGAAQSLLRKFGRRHAHNLGSVVRGGDQGE